MRQLLSWLAPRAPDSIREELERQQLARIREHLPLLYLMASLNVVIVLAACARAGVDVRYYGWMAGFIVLAFARTLIWRRTKHVTLAADAVSRLLRRSVTVGVSALAVLSVFATSMFIVGPFAGSTLMPTSLAFGSMSIAYCMATLRPSAVAALAVGVVPPAIALLAFGNFDARVLGLSLVTVAVLMIRFVGSQYDLLTKELLLQKEVFDLANTDMLTSLPNRRAIVGALEKDIAAGERFAIALLDLDGFKGVNDKLGHLAGDQLLRIVAGRMTAACAPPHASAGRLGGDEFLVIFRAIEGVLDVGARSEALLAALGQPTVIERETVHVRASCGTATFPADGTATALLAVADAALYADKRARSTSGERSEDRRRHRA